MPPKSSRIRFDDLGNVIIEPGELAPSEAVLRERAMILEGQEERADSGELRNRELLTPEELLAFVGGHNDLSTEALVNIRLAELSNKTQRELSKDQVDQVQMANLATRQAAVDAAAAAAGVATGAPIPAPPRHHCRQCPRRRRRRHHPLARHPGVARDL